MSFDRRTFLKGSSLSILAVTLPLGHAWAAETVVRYGGSAWLGHYPAWLAMQKGLLQQAGIKQDWQSFGTSSSRMSAIMSGGIDIAGTGIVSAMALMARGARQFSIIAIPESFGRVEGILAREDVKTIADLKGKKLGVTYASSAHLLVLDVLSKAGLTEKDVEVLNVPAPELPGAMQSGQIDAAAAWTPQFDVIQQQAGISVLADDTSFSLYQSHQVTPGPDVLVVRNAFAEQHPEVVKAYLQAYFKANALLRDQPEEAAQTLMSLTNLQMETQMNAVRGADWYTLEQQPQLLQGPYIEGLQKLGEMLVEHKQIDKAPAVKDWINAAFV